MGGTGRRGLGRGLGAIISSLPDNGAFPLSAALPGGPDATGGLDELGAALDLDLCAHLHEEDGGPRQLLVRARALDAEEALDLSTALGRLLRSSPSGPVVLHVAGYTLLVLATVGARSRGVHAVGRRRGALDPVETRVALRLCRAIGESLHGPRPGDVDRFVDRAS